MTEPLVSDIDRAPASLVRLRARALRQQDRKEEARQLLIRLAKSDFAGRRPAAGTLLDLSELFAAAGEFDTAIKLSEKADRLLPRPRGERRRKQLALDRDLATSYGSYRLRPLRGALSRTRRARQYARGVTVALEKERQRLEHWIPGAGNKPVEVYLFPMRDFFENFGGDMGVVGLFDGKVRVPFAEVRSLHPELVSILSHELAHAMIAAATHDQAPHWFQEGMAEHIEMGRGRLNPMPDLARAGRVLSFPTIDPILRGFAERAADRSRLRARRPGRSTSSRRASAPTAIHQLIAAYAAGKTTDQALQQACGLSPAEFDRAFWQWGTTQAPQTHEVDVRRYDVEYRAQVNKEHKKDVSAILRVGGAEQANNAAMRQKEAADEQRRKMAAWHATYSASAGEIRLAVSVHHPALSRKCGWRRRAGLHPAGDRHPRDAQQSRPLGLPGPRRQHGAAQRLPYPGRPGHRLPGGPRDRDPLPDHRGRARPGRGVRAAQAVWLGAVARPSLARRKL